MKSELLDYLMEEGMDETMLDRLRNADWEELVELIEKLYLMCTDLDRFDEVLKNCG